MFSEVADHPKNVVIPGGVDVEVFRPDGPVAEIESWMRDRTGRLVVCAGRLTPAKGFKYLIDAMRDIDAEAFILGDGNERAELERYAADNDRVQLIGYVGSPLPQQIFRRADVVVVPSVWAEPFGLVCLEAMASGTPVVASRVGGIPKRWYTARPDYSYRRPTPEHWRSR